MPPVPPPSERIVSGTNVSASVPRLDPHHGCGGAGRLLLALARAGLDEEALPAAAALVAALDVEAAERFASESVDVA